MNFPPFGSHFSTAIPSIHQFAAKFTQDNSLCTTQDNNRYTANGVPSFTQHHPATQQQMLTSGKYQGNYMNQSLYGHQSNVRQEKRTSYEHQDLAQELCAVMLHQNQQQQEKQKIKQDENDRRSQQHNQQIQQQQNLNQNQSINTTTAMPSAWQSLATPGSTVADYLSHLPASTLPLSLHQFLKYSAESIKKESAQQLNMQNNSEANLNLLPNNALGINGLSVNNLNTNILSTNSNNLSNGAINGLGNLSTINTAQLAQSNITSNVSSKKKKKKKPEKEKKPRPKPGEIRLTTALDGSTLYCCPECHMAYPEKELLEQHLVGHTLERRFVCDICGAGLKRKDHLTRHKQSHNPERPYVCTVCLKAFKRKEQLTLHFVIHSGEKRHVCSECGKGFYRKDHLRKHTRSHIARRVKAELSQQGNAPATLHLGLATSNNNTVTQTIHS
ncbi:unnamed protein product [Brassicogethes aeneus]|uniref:C2H2-type domain-containing protein n=1 Tax=Brassicogethes aeneus TaxID=1431903 RepID=A0A9P0FQP1_BRAAE|nr:unnamed protein product [Brassicogethes aeneus]